MIWQESGNGWQVDGKNGNVVSDNGHIHVRSMPASCRLVYGRDAVRSAWLARYAVVQVRAALDGATGIELKYHKVSRMSRRWAARGESSPPASLRAMR